MNMKIVDFQMVEYESLETLVDNCRWKVLVIYGLSLDDEHLSSLSKWANLIEDKKVSDSTVRNPVKMYLFVMKALELLPASNFLFLLHKKLKNLNFLVVTILCSSAFDLRFHTRRPYEDATSTMPCQRCST